jgi:hypothetical protein
VPNDAQEGFVDGQRAVIGDNPSRSNFFMKKLAKRVFRAFLPPVVSDAVRFIRNRIGAKRT